MNKTKDMPRWLKRLKLVKTELREVRFPRSAEDGLRQCAALSALALRLLREEVKRTRTRGDVERANVEMRRFLARLSSTDSEWTARWRRDCARFFRG